MKTALNLLTRDGACYMAFSPHQTAEQYTELVHLAEVCDINGLLRTQVTSWARFRGLRFSLDEAKEPTAT